MPYEKNQIVSDLFSSGTLYKAWIFNQREVLGPSNSRGYDATEKWLFGPEIGPHEGDASQPVKFHGIPARINRGGLLNVSAEAAAIECMGFRKEGEGLGFKIVTNPDTLRWFFNGNPDLVHYGEVAAVARREAHLRHNRMIEHAVEVTLGPRRNPTPIPL